MERVLCVRIPEESVSIDDSIGRCTAFLAGHGVAKTDRFTIVLRELLKNAVAHGNGGDLSRPVTWKITAEDGGGFSITVEDMGDGFDYSELNMGLPEDPRRLRNRGYVLINAMAERLTFNAPGNRVTALVSERRYQRILES